MGRKTLSRHVKRIFRFILGCGVLDVIWHYNVLTGEPLTCLACVFWQGSSLTVRHYKKSEDERRDHYKRTWNLTKEESAAEVGYRGKVHLTGTAAWDACFDNAAANFVRYQEAVHTVPWAHRTARSAEQVCLLGRVSGPPCRPYFAVIDVVMKSERLEYVVEFIEHHLSAGFGHIYMAVNEGPADYQAYADALQKYVDANVLTLWRIPGPGAQSAGHSEHFKYANATFWMARIDIDEFIIPASPSGSIVPLLLPLTGCIGKVPMQLKMGRYDFGGGGWLHRPPASTSLLEAYRHRTSIPGNVKSIFQTDALLLSEEIVGRSLNPHMIFGGSITCEDAHWVYLYHWAYVCFPQVPKIYWPPPLPSGLTVPLRSPLAEILWNTEVAPWASVTGQLRGSVVNKQS